MSPRTNDAYIHADPDDLMGSIQRRVVVPRPDCHIWVAATDRGYGRIYLDGTAKRVHRVVWELVNGPIPEGLTVDHLCRIRACVNPEHMELVTPEENVRRSWASRPKQVRRKPIGPRRPRPPAEPKTHCIHGHEFTPENTRVDKRGRRRCRACGRRRDYELREVKNQRRRERRARARAERDAA